MTNLNLAHNNLRPRDKKVLGEALFSNSQSQLKYFSCNEWSIGPEDTSLKLSRKNLGAHDFVLIAGLMSKNQTITEVDLSFNHGACGDYQGSGQYDEAVEGIHALCDALMLSARVTSLNLAGNNIKAVGCDLIAQLLEKTSALTDLDLSCNQLLMNGPASIEILSFQAFCESLKRSKTLRALNLAENSLCAYRDYWRIMHGERRGIQALCSALESNNSITRLDVSRNYMGHEDVTHLRMICDGKQVTPITLNCDLQRATSSSKFPTKLVPVDRPHTAPAPHAAMKKKRMVASASKV